MSGTSLDGVSVGYSKIEKLRPHKGSLIKSAVFAYPREITQALAGLAGGKRCTAEDLAIVHRAVGEHYADVVERFLERYALPYPELISIHGHTVHHKPRKKGSITFQIGDPSPVFVRADVPVVSDFRSADCAAGGQGAPLVAVADYLRYSDDTRTRAIVNIGGIANLTYLEARKGIDSVVAFDTGPGVLLIDAAVRKLTRNNYSYDKDGKLARQGEVSKKLMSAIRQLDGYENQSIPKTTGRERYGKMFLQKVLDKAKTMALSPADIVATISAYTVLMITLHLRSLELARSGADEIILGGGGSKNLFLLSQLKEALPHIKVSTHEDYGIPRDSWEVYAFAVLGYLAFHHITGNIPNATGASRAVVLGRINYPSTRSLE
jgi:anhydro-N-acetylmuramic acid kinase